MGMGVLLFTSSSICTAESYQGLPPTRLFPFEEIGNPFPGVLIENDVLGRIALLQEGSFIVFDGKNWIDKVTRDDPDRNISRLLNVPDGTTFFVASGRWGTLTVLPNGTIKTQLLNEPDSPSWLSNTTFSEIFYFPEDIVVFVGNNGLIVYDRKSKKQNYIHVPRTVCAFMVSHTLYVVGTETQTLRLSLRDLALEKLPYDGSENTLVAGNVNDELALLFTDQLELMEFKGQKASHIHTEIDSILHNGVSVIASIDSNRFAIAVKKKGLFIVNHDYKVEMAFEDTIYRNISDLHINEPGVLWVSTGDGLVKILFDYPISKFDHHLGFISKWPKALQYKGETLLSGDGGLYKPVPPDYGKIASYTPLIEDVAWAVESTPFGIIFGNERGVNLYDDGKITSILNDIYAIRIIYTDPINHTCLVVGQNEIAAIRWIDGKWKEFTPRVPGIGYPFLAHNNHDNSTWVELGVGMVGNIAIINDRIEAQVYDNFNWKENPAWLNLGFIDNCTIITNATGDYMFLMRTAVLL